jgi:thioredoxin 1
LGVVVFTIHAKECLMSFIRLSFATITLLLMPVFCFAAGLPSANEFTIRAALASGKPTVADFGARSCIPCKKMAPILEGLDIELKGRANVLFSDLTESRTLAGAYRIQMMPTQIFFDAYGKEVKRHIGFMDKAAILKELKAAGLK